MEVPLIHAEEIKAILNWGEKPFTKSEKKWVVFYSRSVYEAVTIQTLVLCTSKGRGYYHIWYIYMQAALQLVQVWYYYLLILS